MSLPAIIVAALIAGLALGGTAGWKVQAWRWAATDAARIQAEQEATRLQSTALARSAERNDRDTTDALRKAAASAAGARDDLERLRHATASVQAGDPGAACEPERERLARLNGLLAEGAGLVEEGGRRVEQLALEKAGLQRDAAALRGVLVAP